MRSFKQHILNEDKNTHLEHVEDEVFVSYESALNAVNFIEGVVELLKGNSDSSYNLTVKWDGAPAVFCGTDPETGKFFVGTKSIFNKTPKVNYTPGDVKKNHSGDLAKKLIVALAYLPELGIRGVLQGDMMFTSKDTKSIKLDGESHISFRPNTITYAFPEDSDVGKEIKKAKIGIVFHTTYTGKSLSTMKASFGADVHSLKRSRNVWVSGADFKDASGTATLTAQETSDLESQIGDIRSSLKSAKGAITTMSSSLVGPFTKTYLNSQVKLGKKDLDTASLKAFVVNHFDARIAKVKKDKTKERKEQEKQDVLSAVDDNSSDIESLFDLVDQMRGVKAALLNKMNSINSIRTLLPTNDGFEVVNPEGYVAIDHTGKNAVKFVDRMEFSKANFTVAKDWVKG
tara:strand:+ start:115 stop:1317 length:1203 start_codon:yes stop_codon:yes gene_type:complete